VTELCSWPQLETATAVAASQHAQQHCEKDLCHVETAVNCFAGDKKQDNPLGLIVAAICLLAIATVLGHSLTCEAVNYPQGNAQTPGPVR
jgi:hypothetical protein